MSLLQLIRSDALSTKILPTDDDGIMTVATDTHETAAPSRPGLGRLLASHPILLAAVIAAAALYLGRLADQGWIPHDEGLLAGAAERVLRGELPHRDFSDTYTGGLALLHASAFRLLGVHLLASRITLLVASLFFVAALYRIAARYAAPPLAALVTAVAVAWSLPNYFAGMPSWYILFFSVFGALALVQYFETSRRRWLVAAGACAGLAFLMKSHGLSVFAAALLALVYHERTTARDEAPEGRDPLFRLFVAAALAAFVVSLFAMVARRMTSGDVVYFIVPGSVLALFLVVGELRLAHRGRWRRLLAPIAVFVAGAAVPVVLFLLPYAATGSLGDLVNGIFVLPQRRFGFAEFPPPKLVALIAALPVAVLLAAASWPRSRRGRPGPLGTALLAAAVLLLGLAVAFGGRSGVYTGVWLSVRPLVPLAAIAGCLVLAGGSEIEATKRSQVFLALAMCAMLSLVQFPYAHGIYFCYAAPWVVLAMATLVVHEPRAPRRWFLALLVFYGLFAVVWLNGSYVNHLGFRHTPVTQETAMGIERGGLRIAQPMALFYRQLVDVVQAHSDDGAYIYAAPDCPEVYFLSGRRNPTRTFFDFLDEDFGGDPAKRAARILTRLEEHDVDLVVLHWEPEFSGRVPPELASAVSERYPRFVNLRPFTVHWRE